MLAGCFAHYSHISEPKETKTYCNFINHLQKMTINWMTSKVIQCCLGPHKLLLATHPAAFRVLKVRHCKSWIVSRAVLALCTLWRSLSFEPSWCFVCSFRKPNLLIKEVENHLFFYGYFQFHLKLAGAREGQDDGTRGCKRTLATITTCQAVALPSPNPEKSTHWKKTWGQALHIPLLLGPLKPSPAVSKTCYSSYC